MSAQSRRAALSDLSMARGPGGRGVPRSSSPMRRQGPRRQRAQSGWTEPPASGTAASWFSRAAVSASMSAASAAKGMSAATPKIVSLREARRPATSPASGVCAGWPSARRSMGRFCTYAISSATAAYLRGSLAASAICSKPAAQRPRKRCASSGSPRNRASALSLPKRRLSPPARTTAQAAREALSPHPRREDPLQRRRLPHQLQRQRGMPARVPVADGQAHVLPHSLGAQRRRREAGGHAEEEDLAPLARREDAPHLRPADPPAAHHQPEPPP